MSLTSPEQKSGDAKFVTSWARPVEMGPGERFATVVEIRNAVKEHKEKSDAQLKKKGWLA